MAVDRVIASGRKEYEYQHNVCRGRIMSGNGGGDEIRCMLNDNQEK